MAVEHSVSKRVIYFDILRVVAIFAVVAVHISAQHWLDVDVSSRAWFAFNLYCTTGKWSVPIFVMISGALFLGRDTTIRTILKKNVLRMAGVFVFWSGCYALISLIFRRSPLFDVFSQFITGHYHLWFLYMIVGLYLLIPLLRPIVQNETLMRYFLLLAHVHLLLFSARPYRLFCRRILSQPEGVQPQGGDHTLLHRCRGASFLYIRTGHSRQGAGCAQRNFL